MSLCVLLATTFWFFNAMNKNDYNTNIDYPIDLVFDENEYIPVGDIPTEVLINVDGSGWSIISASLGIGIDEYQIFVDSYRGKYYTNGKDLTYYISNHINNNLKVNYIINDTIHFNIEPIVTKTVKIQLKQP